MSCPCFHKLVLHSTIQDKKLRIPDNFVMNFRNELSTVAILSVPDGHVWRVGLEKAENKIWLRYGWQEFVEYYSISVGYFLVFRYEGNSSFNVYIFNLTTAEINYQSNTLSNTDEKQCFIFEEMDDDDPADILGFATSCLIPDSFKNKVFSERVDQLTLDKRYNPPGLQNLFNGSKYQNCLIRANDENLNASKVANISKMAVQSTRDTAVQFSGMEFKSPSGKLKLHGPGEDVQRIKKTIIKKRKVETNMEESSAQHEEGAEMRFRFYASASTRKRTVTAEEREIALHAAKAFEPFNPFCRVVLRPSYLYRGCIMYLPSCFAEKNLNGVSGFIKLQLSNGKQWPVRCLYRGGRAKLSQGWYEFSLDNNLGEGDVCVFELLKMREIVLKVTIFRVLEDAGVMNRPSQQNFRQSKLIRT